MAVQHGAPFRRTTLFRNVEVPKPISCSSPSASELSVMVLPSTNSFWPSISKWIPEPRLCWIVLPRRTSPPVAPTLTLPTRSRD